MKEMVGDVWNFLRSNIFSNENLVLTGEKLGLFFYAVKPHDVDAETVWTASIGPHVSIMDQVLPYFFFFCFMELLFSYIQRGRSVYRIDDFLASVGSGLANQYVGLISKLWLAPFYLYLYENWRIVDDWRAFAPEGNVHVMVPGHKGQYYDEASGKYIVSWSDTGVSYGLLMYWVIAAVIADLSYYWFHRFSHTFHLAWMTHQVHHSGEDFNLATAMRQGALQPLFSGVYNLFQAVLGVAPAMYALHSVLNAVTQFWIHTELLGRMWYPIEYIFNTPSHHRMHHHYPGSCNYGGFLIVWDRIFGTFREEVQYDSNYGLAIQMRTFNAVRMNWRGLTKMPMRTRGPCAQRSKFRLRFNPLKVFYPMEEKDLGDYDDNAMPLKRLKFGGAKLLMEKQEVEYVTTEEGREVIMIKTSLTTSEEVVMYCRYIIAAVCIMASMVLHRQLAMVLAYMPPDGAGVDGQTSFSSYMRWAVFFILPRFMMMMGVGYSLLFVGGWCLDGALTQAEYEEYYMSCRQELHKSLVEAKKKAVAAGKVIPPHLDPQENPDHPSKPLNFANAGNRKYKEAQAEQSKRQKSRALAQSLAEEAVAEAIGGIASRTDSSESAATTTAATTSDVAEKLPVKKEKKNFLNAMLTLMAKKDLASQKKDKEVQKPLTVRRRRMLCF